MLLLFWITLIFFCINGSLTMLWFALVFALLSVIFYYRFEKFFSMYSHEAIMTFVSFGDEVFLPKTEETEKA